MCVTTFTTQSDLRFAFFIQVVSDLPFLHPSETEILNHLCKLGSYYQRFEAFIKRYSILLPQKATGEAGLFQSTKKSRIDMFNNSCHLGLGGLPVFRFFSVLFSNRFFRFSFYKNRKTVIT
jgi:hypothetical protein